MRLLSAVRALLILVVVSPSAIFAQSSQAVSSASVPRLINISGVFRPANGQPAAAVETVTLSIYADQEGGAPLWQETQTIALDAQGRYALLLGATRPDGIPAAVFGSGDAQWLATVFERAGEVEGPRVRITSVPYALRASDADTLGGRPAADYLLTRAAARDGVSTGAASVDAAPGASADLVQPGIDNSLAKYTNGGTDLDDSAVYEVGGKVGVGTSAPLDALHVRFNSVGGALTGYAVQNTALSPTAYSGMLFYDNNGALAQFQGFNNSTHEYRINNIASGGSINFMLGGASKFNVASNGNIGIGTTAPSALLEVSNAVPGGPANMWMTSYTNACCGPYYIARRTRGTSAAPTAVQAGDGLAGFYGTGYGTTTFNSGFTGGMTVVAAQNWTDTQQGTALLFATTPINSATAATRMTLDASGNLGIGTTTVPAAGILEVSNAAHSLSFAQVTATTYASAGQGSLFVGRKARGTAAVPTAVQSGDVLAGYVAQGYGASAFSGSRGGMFVVAAEPWTNAAQGTNLAFNTTATGTITPSTKMTITANGNIGIGTGGPSGAVEVARTGTSADFVATSFGDEASFFARTARGTASAPTATQFGDFLGAFGTTGYGTTGFGEGNAFVGGFAAENWTDAAQGAALGLAATPLGSNEAQVNLIVLPGGNVGIGLFEDFPTITDKLQVFGDIRVGTTGTNGCLKDFGGNPLAGTCASDRRFKKDITPFGHVLDRLTGLQPVHYFWRASEFPDRQFGQRRGYGLIAQDVEQTLPELVVTNDDGFKAVDYSKLPLLAIQAVKDLKTENDALKLRVAELEKSDPEALQQRVAELERLVTEVLAAASRR